MTSIGRVVCEPLRPRCVQASGSCEVDHWTVKFELRKQLRLERARSSIERALVVRKELRQAKCIDESFQDMIIVTLA